MVQLALEEHMRVEIAGKRIAVGCGVEVVGESSLPAVRNCPVD
jgi:hypothetical protein